MGRVSFARAYRPTHKHSRAQALKSKFLSFLGRKVAKYVGFEVAKVVTVMSEVL